MRKYGIFGQLSNAGTQCAALSAAKRRTHACGGDHGSTRFGRSVPAFGFSRVPRLSFLVACGFVVSVHPVTVTPEARANPKGVRIASFGWFYSRVMGAAIVLLVPVPPPAPRGVVCREPSGAGGCADHPPTRSFRPLSSALHLVH